MGIVSFFRYHILRYWAGDDLFPAYLFPAYGKLEKQYLRGAIPPLPLQYPLWRGHVLPGGRRGNRRPISGIAAFVQTSLKKYRDGFALSRNIKKT